MKLNYSRNFILLLYDIIRLNLILCSLRARVFLSLTLLLLNTVAGKFTCFSEHTFHASLNTVSSLQCSRIIRFSEHDVLRSSEHGMPSFSKYSSHASAYTDCMLQCTHITRSSEHRLHASMSTECNASLNTDYSLQCSHITHFSEPGILRLSEHRMTRFSEHGLQASVNTDYTLR